VGSESHMTRDVALIGVPSGPAPAAGNGTRSTRSAPRPTTLRLPVASSALEPLRYRTGRIGGGGGPTGRPVIGGLPKGEAGMTGTRPP
jgi:hypothetical protein